MREWPWNGCSASPEPTAIALAGLEGRHVTILALGRSRGMGEAVRLASWEAIVRAGGATSSSVALLRDHRARVPSALGSVLRGRTVPEAMAWSVRSVEEALSRASSDVVICLTARAFHPALVADGRTVLLDFVDRLSVSYRDRARITGAPHRRLLFRGLAITSDHFERRTVPPGVRRVAAGWEDANHLEAEWLPIVVKPAPPCAGRDPDADVLFFGNLAYPPNVAAVERLDRLWPLLLRRRPGTTARVAGANPVPTVRRIAAKHGWDLVADFPDVAALCGGARLSVAPLDYTAGIQIKVLEAAAHGLAQVVTPAALRGMRPGFPVTVATGDSQFVTEVSELLDHPDRRDGEGAAARRHIEEHYTAAAWAPWLARLLAP